MTQAGLNVALGALDLLSVPQAGVIGGINQVAEDRDTPGANPRLPFRFNPFPIGSFVEGAVRGLSDPESARPESLPGIRDADEGPGRTVAALLVGAALDPTNYVGLGLFDDGARLLRTLDGAIEEALGLGRRDIDRLDELVPLPSVRPRPTVPSPSAGKIELLPVPGNTERRGSLYVVRSQLVAGRAGELEASVRAIHAPIEEAAAIASASLRPGTASAVSSELWTQAQALTDAGGVVVRGLGGQNVDLAPVADQVHQAVRDIADPQLARELGEEAAFPFFLENIRAQSGVIAGETSRSTVEEARRQASNFMDFLEREAILNLSIAAVRAVGKELMIETARLVLESQRAPVLR